MKKLILLSMVVAFVLVGAQAFASPPIQPPVEGFIILTTTRINAVGTVIENETYNWTYYEGWGKGPFFPNNAANPYVPAGCGTSAACAGKYSELGFTEGAEIAYVQTFKAPNGTTSFFKTFEAYSNPDAAAGKDNLIVHKEITYTGLTAKDIATHSEKVGLSVVSMGAASSSGSSPAAGLLSLCPWGASTPPGTGGGYPPTNEGIAGGSSFKVNSITNFTSDARVNSSVLPMLSYNVVAPQGVGFIDAGFVVELYEGPAGTTWAPVAASAYCSTCVPVTCDPRAGTVCYQNQVAPPLASRTSYKEYASAEGTWSFSKNMKYQSTMPSGPGAGTFPINTVLP